MPRGACLLVLACAVAEAAPASAQEAGFWGLGDLPGGDHHSLANGISADGSTVVGESFSDAGREPFVWTFAEGMRPLGDAPIPGRAYAVSGDGSVVVGDLDDDFRWNEEDGVGPFVPEFACPDCVAFGVSDDGTTVVGRSDDPNVPGAARIAVVWTEDQGMREVGPLPGAPRGRNQATAASADGSVVVGSGPNATGDTMAFVWDAQNGARPLGDLPGGGVQSIPSDVSPDGSIVVGQSFSEDGPEAFVWTAADGMRGLGDLPGPYFLSLASSVLDDGTVLGRASTALGNEPIVWTEEDGMRTVQEILDENGIDTGEWTLFVCCPGPAGMSDDGRIIAGTGLNPQGEIEAWIAVLPPPPPIPVRIDLRPFREDNRIRLMSLRRVAVVLFGSDELPVDAVDAGSLAFGPDGARPVGPVRVRDRDGDGRPDLILRFRVRELGLAFGDTEVCLEGLTTDGDPLEGCDAVEVVPPCGEGHLQALALVPVLWIGARWRSPRRRPRP